MPARAAAGERPASADDKPASTEDIETWRVKATILALVSPSDPSVCSDNFPPVYRVVTHDVPVTPDTQEAALELAEKWANKGVFVPGPDPQPAETFGTFYPAHRVQAVEVYVAY